MRFARVAAALVLLMASSGPVSAHPHIWLTLKSEVAFTEDGRVAGLGLTWIYDEAFAQVTLEGLDKDGDGVYAETELRALTKANMVSLKDWNYLTVIRYGDEKQAFGDADPEATRHIWKDGSLSIRFFLPLKMPVDPRKARLTVTVFDPSYFIALEYAKTDPVSVVGSPPVGCAPQILPVPSSAELEEKRVFLATKGKDWTPPPDQEFGEDLAERLIVDCAS
jgi:ABC-type uncharacterized transport system substrate-binding protein